MKKKAAFVLAMVVVALFAGRSFGTLQKISKLGVADINSADSGESWISVTGTGGNTGTVTLGIGFEDESWLDIYFDSFGDGTAQLYSLQDVADQINTESLNLCVLGDGTAQAYTAAYIIDSVVTAGEYSLMLSSRTDPAASIHLTTSSTNAVLSGNFGGVGTDLTGDNAYFFAAVPEPATVFLLGLGCLALRKRRRA